MASARECPLQTAARYLPAAEQRAERALLIKKGHFCDLSLAKVSILPERMVAMESSKLNMNKDFRRLYGRGHNYVHPILVTYIMHNKRNVVRYGITAGKKVGGAVERNRARRLIEAAMRECIKGVDCSGVDIVFVARTRTLSAKSTDVAAVMKKHFEAEGLYPPDES